MNSKYHMQPHFFKIAESHFFQFNSISIFKGKKEKPKPFLLSAQSYHQKKLTDLCYLRILKESIYIGLAVLFVFDSRVTVPRNKS